MITEKDYQVFTAAAAHIKAAEKPIRILRSLAWPGAVEHAFFKSGAQKLPQLSYPKFESAETLRHLAKAKGILAGRDDVIAAWLLRTGQKLELAAAMLEAVGTPDFTRYSCQIYGAPEKLMIDGKTRTLDLAQHMDTVLDGLDFERLAGDTRPPAMDAQAFGAALAERLPRYFGEAAPRIEIDPHMSSKAAAGSRRIRINAGAQFSKMDVRQLIQHEALVHTATALNGRMQDDFKILGAAHAGTTEIQEGLAVFAELISGALDPQRFRRLADRAIAIQMALDGADFIQVYRFFLSKHEQPEQAYDDARRVFRGGVISGGAPFTKDGVYLNGLLRVHNFMRTAIKLKRADLIRLLFVGKMDLEDIPALAILAEAGKLRAPKYLPPWASDMRFLVSYLAYSSFLNQVKLPGFQRYYTDMLDEVPDIWGFSGQARG